MKLLLFLALFLFVVGGYMPGKNNRQLRQAARAQQEQLSNKVQQNQAYTAVESFSKKSV